MAAAPLAHPRARSRARRRGARLAAQRPSKTAAESPRGTCSSSAQNALAGVRWLAQCRLERGQALLAGECPASAASSRPGFTITSAVPPRVPLVVPLPRATASSRSQAQSILERAPRRMLVPLTDELVGGRGAGPRPLGPPRRYVSEVMCRAQRRAPCPHRARRPRSRQLQPTPSPEPSFFSLRMGWNLFWFFHYPSCPHET